jgi:hypothetical protein
MDFKRVPKNQTPGLSVQCAGCGKMMLYDQAFIADRPFAFYHETCAQEAN